jgi:cupin superfamily acireductone dioxygenase involved in methionine salvage
MITPPDAIQKHLYKANRKADHLFSVWRSVYEEYQGYRATQEQLEKSEAEYKLAEKERQSMRREAGLPYLDVVYMTEQTPEYAECCICHVVLEYMEQRYISEGKVYCPGCAFDVL